jgi:hypothetical protein
MSIPDFMKIHSTFFEMFYAYRWIDIQVNCVSLRKDAMNAPDEESGII